MFYCRSGDVFHVAGIFVAGHCHSGDYGTNLGQNTSARELENTVVKPLRQQLIQVARLKDMDSEARDGAGLIRLSFDFGTNTDLAFIEVNEKIDAAMNYLPKDTERPKVVKASATDIPVFYLNLTLKNDSAYGQTDERAFLDLCEFAENVIKRRIEQLTEVAMVDVTGLVERQLQIVPDKKNLQFWDFPFRMWKQHLRRIMWNRVV